MKYKFSVNWFGEEEHINDLKKILPKSKSELHILEIGSYEGRSTIWFLENLLLNKNSTITCIDPWEDYSQNSNSFTSYSSNNSEHKLNDILNTFLFNIDLSGRKDNVIIERGLSIDILPKLLVNNKKYDIIFIDGNHVAPFVLMDAVFSWNLLKDEGLMIFDDYLWKLNKPKTLTPKLAVDSFIEIFQDYSTVVLNKYRKAIKKIKKL